MARFDLNEAEKYGGSMQGGFFSLKNDKDTAQVRFMYESLDDAQGYSVHEVVVDGKNRYVNCLRAYNEPVEKCPFCQNQEKVIAKLFIPLYNMDTEEVQIWDRGKAFIPTITSLCSRYNPLVSTPIEIERNGKKGDRETTYMTYPLQADEVGLADLPEQPQILGTIVLDKNADEMLDYLEYGEFPGTEGEERQPQADTRQQGQPEPRQRRRTPANTNQPVDKF